MFVVFVLWDLAATRAGHWQFDPEQTLPVRLWGLPLEELGFFVVIPLAGLLTYEAVGVVIRRRRSAVVTYTAAAVVGIVAAVVLDLWVLRTRLLATRQWWAAYGIVVGFQLLTNGWLTGRLIVTYDPDAIIGSGTVPFLGDGRIAYAPVEDLGFGFALVLATCALWVWWGLVYRGGRVRGRPDDGSRPFSNRVIPRRLGLPAAERPARPVWRSPDGRSWPLDGREARSGGAGRRRGDE